MKRPSLTRWPIGKGRHEAAGAGLGMIEIKPRRLEVEAKRSSALSGAGVGRAAGVNQECTRLSLSLFQHQSTEAPESRDKKFIPSFFFFFSETSGQSLDRRDALLCVCRARRANGFFLPFFLHSIVQHLVELTGAEVPPRAIHPFFEPASPSIPSPAISYPQPSLATLPDFAVSCFASPLLLPLFCFPTNSPALRQRLQSATT